MKSSILAFAVLVAFSCFWTAESATKCYSCAACSSKNPADDPVQDCPSSDYYCLKSVAKIFGQKIISKSCAKTCEESSIDILVTGSTTTCCSTDLCNSTPVKTFSLLTIATCMLWTISALI